MNRMILFVMRNFCVECFVIYTHTPHHQLFRELRLQKHFDNRSKFEHSESLWIRSYF